MCLNTMLLSYFETSKRSTGGTIPLLLTMTRTNLKLLKIDDENWNDTILETIEIAAKVLDTDS